MPHRSEGDAPEPYRLEGIELATALVYGVDPGVAPLDLAVTTPPPRAVLETSLLSALQRPPCVVGFSGGRDSSALLALAAHLARREGLDPPVAATNVFPGDVQAAESEWQELLIRHLGDVAWERLRFTDELDVVGPVAAPLLDRHGPTFPFNGHFGMPSFAMARGGTYLTGVGGDELFEPNDLTRLALVLRRRLGPRRGDVVAAWRHFGPRLLAVRHYRRIIPPEPWLLPDISRTFTTDLANVLAGQRLWYSDQIRHDVGRDRAASALQQTLTAFATTVGAVVVQPFTEPLLLRSIARYAGRVPWVGRAAAMRELFGDVLPPEVVDRRTKASFDTIFFNGHSRAFVQDWDGSGVDGRFVDIDRLRAAWRRPSVDARSLSLLQAAWYHNNVGGAARQPLISPM